MDNNQRTVDSSLITTYTHELGFTFQLTSSACCCSPLLSVLGPRSPGESSLVWPSRFMSSAAKSTEASPNAQLAGLVYIAERQHIAHGIRKYELHTYIRARQSLLQLAIFVWTNPLSRPRISYWTWSYWWAAPLLSKLRGIKTQTALQSQRKKK